MTSENAAYRTGFARVYDCPAGRHILRITRTGPATTDTHAADRQAPATTEGTPCPN